MSTVADDIEMIRALIKWADSNANQIAKKIGVANTTINRFNNGKANSRLGRDTLARLKEHFPNFPGFVVEAEQLERPADTDYVEVEVLPTYAGMGGGGSGDGDREIALLPRVLVVDMLRGRPKDFLLVNVRGDSMEPDFYQGDQILIDTRDTSPSQPGPFALWDGEWGEYVVKNVERSTDGRVRIFSTNAKYTETICANDQTRIIGRPVWFGRRL